VKKRTLDRAAREVLAMKLPEGHPLLPELAQYGLEPTGAQAVCYALFRKAAAGDVSAAKLLRELVGDKGENGEAAGPSGSDAFAAMSDERLLALLAGSKSEE